MGANSQYLKVTEVSKIIEYGLMPCFRALKRTDWDVQRAVKYLQEHPPVYLS